MKKKPRIRVKSIIYLSLMAIILALGCVTPGIHCIQPVDHSEPISGDILNPQDVGENARVIAISFVYPIRVDSDGDGVFTEVTQENEDAGKADLMQIGDKITFQDEWETDITFSTDWVDFDPPVLKITPDGPFTLDRNYNILLPSASERLIRLSGENGAWASMDFTFSFKTREPDGTMPTLEKFSAGGVTINSPSSSEFIDFPISPNMDIVIKFSEEMNPSFGFIINPEITEENVLNIDSITSDNITFTVKLTGLDIGEDLYFEIISTGDGVAGLPMAAVALGDEDIWEEIKDTFKDIFGEDYEFADPLDYTKSLPPCRDMSGEPLSFFDGVSTLVPRGFIIQAPLARVRIDEPARGQLIDTSTVGVSGIYVYGHTDANKNVNMIWVNGITADMNEGYFSTTFFGLTEGPLTITAVADCPDGIGGYDQIKVFIDTIPPAIVITNPVDGSFQNSRNIIVTGTVSDPYPGSGITLVTVNGITAFYDGSNFIATLTDQSEGYITIVATAEDMAGHISTESIEVMVDTVPPQIQIISPADGVFIYSSTVVVSGMASDPLPGSGIASVMVNGVMASFDGGTFTAVLTDQPEGDLTIIATAVDNVGNTSIFSINVIRGPDNEWVCLNPYICEYQDITSALEGENNTANTIYLKEPNYVFTINNIATYTLTGIEAIQFSKYNQTLDCNGSLLIGSGGFTKGININAHSGTVENCNLEGFGYGIFGEDYQDINIIGNEVNDSTFGINILGANEWIFNNTLRNNTYGIVVGNKHPSNSLIEGNSIYDSTFYGIWINNTNPEMDQYVTFADFTENSIYNSGTYDLYIDHADNANNSFWLNNFYSEGINDLGTDNNFCVDNEGNFYEEGISSNNIGSNDCGLTNIIYPDGGYSWIETGSFEETEFVGSLLQATDGAILAVVNSISIYYGDPLIHVSTLGEVYSSIDGRDTWNNIGTVRAVINPLWVKSLLQADDGTIYAGGEWQTLIINPETGEHLSGRRGYVTKSIDNGITWSSWGDTGLEEVDDVQALLQAEDGAIYAGTNIGIFRYNTSTAIWTPVLGGGIYSLLQAVDGTIYAGENGFVYKSTDGGDTWTETGDLGYLAGSINSLLQAVNGTIFAGSNGIVFMSTDGGDTWTETSELEGAGNILSLIQTLEGAAYGGTDEIYAGTDGGIFRYDDLNGTWSRKLEEAVKVFSLIQADDGTIYAGGEKEVGVVFKSIDGGEIIADNPLSIKWTKQSSSNPISYQLYYSNNSGDSWNYIDTTTSLNYSWDITELPNQGCQPVYLVKVVPNDGLYNATNDQSANPFTVCLDKSPSISITYPADEAFVTTSPILVSGTVSDPFSLHSGIASVKVNEVEASFDSVSFTATLTNQPEGPLTLIATATDNTGNVATDSINVFIDTLPPIISITYPVDGTFITTSTILVSVTVSEPLPGSGIASIKVNEVEASFDGVAFSVTFTDLPEGPLSITATATDNASNLGIDSINVIIDFTPPDPPVLNQPTSPTTAQQIGVTGSAEPLSTITIFVNGVADSTTITDDNGFFSLPNVSLSEGINTLTAIATDMAGNESLPSEPVQVIKDTTPPIITITSPPDDSTWDTVYVNVEGEFDDITTTTVSVNGVPADVIGNQFSATVPFTAPTTFFIVTATDELGNSSSESVKAHTISPIISEIAPNCGQRDSVVTINGYNFSTTPSENNVYFDTVQATVNSAAETSLVVVVPSTAVPGLVFVVVNGLTSNKQDFLVMPTLQDLIPACGKPGEIIEITGSPFSPDVSYTAIFTGFDTPTVESPANFVDSSTVDTTVPDGAWDGPLKISAGNCETNSLDFTFVPLSEEKKYFYHNDALGSPVAMTDEKGTVVWRQEYLPFGSEVAGVGLEEVKNIQTFTGKEFDEDTGLFYFKARYYDPSLGRFISIDPKQQGNNLYVYCNNNPYRYVDPTGEIFWDIVDVVSFAHSAYVMATDPSWSNFGWLAMDIAGLLPLVPGSWSVKAVKYGTKVAHNAKRVSSTARIIKGAKYAGKIDDVYKFVESGGLIVDTYSRLHKITKYAGLKRHHLIEKRLAEILGVSEGSMMSVALTKAQHDVFTARWKEAIEYLGKGNYVGKVELKRIREAAEFVYKDSPELLKEALDYLGTIKIP